MVRSVRSRGPCSQECGEALETLDTTSRHPPCVKELSRNQAASVHPLKSPENRSVGLGVLGPCGCLYVGLACSSTWMTDAPPTVRASLSCAQMLEALAYPHSTQHARCHQEAQLLLKGRLTAKRGSRE